MPIIKGKLICGKRDAATFERAVRPDPITNECQSSYSPCSSFTSPDNTYCLPSFISEMCPITHIRFEKSSKLATYLQKSQYEWTTQPFDDEHHIMWTKDYDSLPVVMTTIQ